MKSSKEVRVKFLDFFRKKAHHIVPSAPIVVKDDPTLMFTNAGMNQFKDIFLEIKTSEHSRVANTQKCLRVSGKHNDLEEVGHDTYHHTMFEMLGNWSFGDYYKKDAIAWAWELLTEHYKLDPDRLYATVFGGDAEDGVPPDAEAREEWARYLPQDRILDYGKKDNFWEMGDVGPSGPCSEIHIDLRSEAERAQKDGSELVNAGDPQVIEIWNLVFIQYNRKADGRLEELPSKHVDTGMGFERLLMVIQGKQSTYDTDLFDPTREFLEFRTGLDYESAPEDAQVAMRVVMDHIRAIVFAIADGQIPSNTGAGYVIRRILRRASRYAFAYLGLSEPFLFELVDLLAEIYRGVFDEVEAQQEFIKRIIKEEEKNFLQKLERGSQMFDTYLREHRGVKTIEGDFAFKLYDTFGFPIDLTQLMAREKGCTVDMEGFEKELEAQKKRSRAATEVKAGDWVVVHPSGELPRFLGYETLSLETRIMQYRTLEQKSKKIYQVVLEETPFYAESGGQIGDHGRLSKGVEVLRVLDTKKENELIVHVVDKLPEDPEGSWLAEVNPAFRNKVKVNHSATHLMHAALRKVLGPHVEQRGSLVSDELLRFDFSHFAKMTEEELQAVEDIVNEKIAEGIPRTEYRDVPLEEAKAKGAMALFGEKYGERVRVIAFDEDYSLELCGGTHVDNTREIRLFKFASESSIAAGVRRVEAYTAGKALQYLNDQAHTLATIRETLRAPKDPVKAIEELLDSKKQLEKELQALNAEKLTRMREEILQKAVTANGVNLIREVVQVTSADDLKQLAFDLKRHTRNTLIVLGTQVEGKGLLTVILSDDLAENERYHAGKLVRELAKEIQGGGGGQPFYATAGGRNPAGLPKAMEKVEELLTQA